MSGNTRILLLGFLTITSFPLVGLLLFYLITGDTILFFRSFDSKINLIWEILIGIVTGLIFGFSAWKLITSKFLAPVLKKYGQVVESLKLKLPTIIFVSICAGVGEEIFFRGFLQEYLGVIITAIIFVAIHGYISWSDWRITIYGIYMTLIITAIGFLDVYCGLTTAMIAHAVIDVVLFYQLSNSDLVKDNSRIVISL